jgi:hypothetical protein
VIAAAPNHDSEHDRYRTCALPGVYVPDEPAMERARRQNGSRGLP